MITAQHGTVAWRSPSNIALIKYWGKKPIQIPANASISFTLSEAYTDTELSFVPRAEQEKWIKFLFEGKEESSFALRIEKYFDSISDELPWIKDLAFTIKSSNSFPHSSGIASSASSMSALALCLCDIQAQQTGREIDLQQASHLARLGSGSASRSVYPKLAAWGRSEHIVQARDEYAVQISDMPTVFETFHDDVLIVSPEKKSVSSTAGHALMDTNPFAATRYAQANDNMEMLLRAMREEDIMTFGKIVEAEAMTLHALMMCSDPSYVLMKPGTLAVIEMIRTYREDTSLPIFFTLDAGPNVHILYPDEIKSQAKVFIDKVLRPLAHEGRVITDHVGNGPIKLK